MPLIGNFNVELKETNVQLKRIGDALTAILREAYGISLEPLHADTSGEPGSVSYSDDRTTLKQELLDLKQGKNPERTINVETED